jgi:hypothetical protein
VILIPFLRCVGFVGTFVSFIAILLQQVNLLTAPATFNFSNGSLNRVPRIVIVDPMEGR